MLSGYISPSWSWPDVRHQTSSASCMILLYTLPCNKVSSYSHSKPFSFLVYHEVVSNTCVVHHRDLRGLPTGGEQPHLRKILHQFRGKHCVPTVGWIQCGEPSPQSEAILALDWVQPDVHLLWSQIILFKMKIIKTDVPLFSSDWGDIDGLNMWMMKPATEPTPNQTEVRKPRLSWLLVK